MTFPLRARRLLRTLAAGSTLGALLLVPAAAQATVTQTFACTGGVQNTTAPPNAVSARVTLQGAAGGSAYLSTFVGGAGETVTFTMPVVSNQGFTVSPGCQSGFSGGGSAGYSNYGSGSGGGASFIAPNGATFSQAYGLAGGGGGAGGAGINAWSGSLVANGGSGGNAAGPSASDSAGSGIAGRTAADGSATGGLPGTGAQGSGAVGAGGVGGAGTYPGGRGANGSAGSGGAGGNPISGAGGGGGGGGGGWLGGGGGGAGGASTSEGGAGGGAGGGTSYLSSSATEVGSAAADVTGNGSVSIVYTVVGDINATPSPADFGQVVEGQPASQTITFSYPGTGDDPATLGQASIAQSGSAYSITSDGCSNGSLSQGQMCTITVSIDASSTGSQPGTLTLPSNAPNAPTRVSLKATAVPPSNIVVRPSPSESFGSVAVGQTQYKTFTVNNTGGVPFSIAQATLSGNAEFSIVQGQDFCSNWTVAAGSNCTLQVAFTPSGTGAETATLSVPSNAANNADVTVALSGTGTPASSTGTLPQDPAVSSSSAKPAPPSMLRVIGGPLEVGSGHPSSLMLTFTMPKPATVVVTLQRRVNGNWRKVGVERVERGAGPQHFRLGEQFAGHMLTPGSYRVLLQSERNGRLSVSVSHVLTVRMSEPGGSSFAG